MPLQQPPSRSRKVAAAAAAACAIAAPAEGIRQVAYYDPPGILTVCRGHTGPDVQNNHVYSLKECDEFMDKDMRKAVTAVDACVPNAPDSVLAAFSDAAYNAGPSIACDREKSTAARLLASSRWFEACSQLPRWNKARIMGVMVELPGLTKRRYEEFNLCVRDLK